MSVKAIPSPLTVVDVETTGLSADDRIVSLGVLHIEDLDGLRNGDVVARATHLIFNPGRPSHPRARKVHGYSDSLLAQQEPFAQHAPDLRQYFDHGGIVVAHNASFDKRFILNEFRAAGAPLKRNDFHCTMLEHRRAYGPPSGMDALLSELGYPQRLGTHGALEDAWYALAVFCWLKGFPVPRIDSMPRIKPLNLVEIGTARPSVPRAVPPPVPPPAPAPAPDLLEDARQRTLPLATAMMFVARADGAVYRAEVEALSLLIDTMLAGTPAAADQDIGAALLAEFADLDPGAAQLDAACDAIIADHHQKGAVSGWIKQITYSDGNASEQEAGAIMRIAEHLRAAHARRAAIGRS